MRVLVVEDSAALARLLVASLTVEARVTVVGLVGEEDEALDAARDLRPDLMTLDLGLRTGGGLGVLRRMRTRCFDGSILVFSGESFATHGQRCIDLGADRYFCKADGHGPLVAAVKQLIESTA